MLVFVSNLAESTPTAIGAEVWFLAIMRPDVIEELIEINKNLLTFAKLAQE
jgi:hypothetical protein